MSCSWLRRCPAGRPRGALRLRNDGRSACAPPAPLSPAAATNAKDGVALLLDDCPGGKHWCTMCLNCVDT